MTSILNAEKQEIQFYGLGKEKVCLEMESQVEEEAGGGCCGEDVSACQSPGVSSGDNLLARKYNLPDIMTVHL